MYGICSPSPCKFWWPRLVYECAVRIPDDRSFDIIKPNIIKRAELPMGRFQVKINLNRMFVWGMGRDYWPLGKGLICVQIIMHTQSTNKATGLMYRVDLGFVFEDLPRRFIDAPSEQSLDPRLVQLTRQYLYIVFYHLFLGKLGNGVLPRPTSLVITLVWFWNHRKGKCQKI